MLEFKDVVDEALEETYAKLRRAWGDPEAPSDAVNFALGLFTGIVSRRLKGQPDPDPIVPAATHAGLFTCPKCKRVNFTKSGLARHVCRPEAR